MRALLLVVLVIAGAVAALWLITATGEAAPADPTSAGPATPVATGGKPATAGGSTSIDASATPSGTEREAVETGPPLRLLHGRVTRGGRPVPGRRVECESLDNGRAEWDTVTATDGTFSFRLPAGRYEVEMPMREGRQVARPRWGRDYRGPPTELPVRAALRRVDLDDDARCDFQLATGAIVVRAIDAVTFQLIPNVVATWYAPPPMLQNLEISCKAGTTRIDDVPDGPQFIGLHRRGYRAATSDRFDVQQDTHTIELRLQPVGALDVVLVDQAGESIALDRELLIDLRGVGDHRHYGEPGNRDAIRDGPPPDRFVYDDIETGRYRIELRADASMGRTTKSVRFAPVAAIDPGTPIEVDVVGRRVVELIVPVQRRSHAKLSGLDRWGNVADAELFLELIDPAAGAIQVVPQPRSRAGYDGYLAPGTYALRFETGGRVSTARLVVGDDGAPIERAFRIE